MTERLPPRTAADWFSTAGRRARLSFLGNFLLVNLGVGIITAIAGTMDGILPPIIAAGCSIAGGWVNICLTSQRLHDIGKNGWVQVTPFVLAILGLAMVAASDQTIVVALGVACVLAATFGFMVWLMAAPGAPGDNAYGPPPARS